MGNNTADKVTDRVGDGATTRKILCCGILQREVEYLLLGKNVAVTYLDPGLHVDFARLAKTLGQNLSDSDGLKPVVVYGHACHPAMGKMAAAHGGRLMEAVNCIEAILGDRLAELDAGGKTFYLSVGWLENWRKIFVEELACDENSAREIFAGYDRLLLLDTGIWPLDQEKVREFAAFTGLPVEAMPISLEHLRRRLEEVIDR